MKKITILCAVICIISGCARLTRVPGENRMIRQVFTVELSRDVLYDRALEWMARKLVSARENIVYQNRDAGKIIAKGIGRYREYFGIFVSREFGYTMTVEVKEGRYRVTYENFVIYYEERDLSHSEVAWKSEIDRIKKKLDQVSDNLKKYLENYTEEATWEEEQKKKEEDDW